MPYQMYWHIDKRVVYMRFHDAVTEEEAIATGDDLAEFIRLGATPLLLVVDTREVTKIPTDLKQLIQGMSRNNNNGASLSHTFIITDNRLVNFFGAMIANVFKTPMRTCRTLDEVETYIANLAPDLADAERNVV